MPRDFQQIEWDQLVAEDCRALVRLAVREDLERQQDWTTVALVPSDRHGAADVVTREPGVVAGMPALETAIDEMQAQLQVSLAADDGQVVAADTRPDPNRRQPTASFMPSAAATTESRPARSPAIMAWASSWSTKSSSQVRMNSLRRASSEAICSLLRRFGGS